MNNIQFVPILAVSRLIAHSSPAANLNSAKLTLLSREGTPNAHCSLQIQKYNKA